MACGMVKDDFIPYVQPYSLWLDVKLKARPAAYINMQACKVDDPKLV